MRIIISVGGRFHAFNLAQQLLKRGYLSKLITSYPKFEVVRYGIPREKIESILVKEILERSWRKLPVFLTNTYNPQFFFSNLYDHAASLKAQYSDICVAWSSFGLETMRQVKRLGALTIIERGSSHIAYQNKILKEEYERFGVNARFQLPHPKIIEKELIEYEEADYVSIPSSFVWRTFVERGIPANKLIQVPYGVDSSQFTPVPKKDEVFRVIFAGGMTLRKGVHYLLRAFSELHLKNAELMLIGSVSDEMKPFFKKYEGHYRWLGHIPQAELFKYYSQGSVFALPSLEEGLAMVIPQAMACGLPVIATTNTGGEDIVRDGIDGYILPIRDAEALQEKLLYCYEHPSEVARMGCSAKERVANGFTWDDYGEKISKAYENILRKKM